MLSPNPPKSRRLTATRLWIGTALGLLAAGCIEVDRSVSTAPLKDRRLLARGVVTAAGGTVKPEDSGASLDRVELIVPPGAVDQDTEISIWIRFGDPRFPSAVQAFEVEPAELRFAVPATMTIKYAEIYETALLSLFREGTIEAFSTADRGLDFSHHPALRRERAKNLLTFATDHLGSFVALHPQLLPMLYQPARIIDPSAMTPVDLLHGELVSTANARYRVNVGKGSLDSFWSSGADRNLMLVHGLLGTAFHFLAPGGFLPLGGTGGLRSDFANIVVFQYPSAASIADSANRLYDEILRNRREGFGLDIVAHSSGGLVARYALERSHGDPARPGYSASDPPLSTMVDRLVLIATPHQGSAQAATLFAPLLSVLPVEDQRFVRGILDILPGFETFTARLNADWSESTTRYYAIAGDVVGKRSDGIVEVHSAVGFPVAWQRPEEFQVFSGPAYDHLSLSASASLTGVLAQTRVWFDKVAGNTPPVIGSVQTPDGILSGEIEIPFSIADADEDECTVVAQFSLNGSEWFPATPAGGGPAVFQLASRRAPGERYVFVWDSRADGMAHNRRVRVIVRFIASDLSGIGTPGSTGAFVVQN